MFRNFFITFSFILFVNSADAKQIKIIREELSINGDKARYNPIQNKLFVFGEVEVLQNQSTILCDKIIVDLENSSSIMSSDTNARVEALIISENKN